MCPDAGLPMLWPFWLAKRPDCDRVFREAETRRWTKRASYFVNMITAREPWYLWLNR